MHVAGQLTELSLHLPVAAASGALQGCRVLVYGYGTFAEVPPKGQYPHLEVLTPGRTILLSDTLPAHAIAGDSAPSCQPAVAR
jgi:hypothetical protein